MIARLVLGRMPGTSKTYDRTVSTVCRECSTCCGLVAYVSEDEIVDIQGAEDHPVSRGRLCARGMAFVQGLDHPDRITGPAGRESQDDNFEELPDWDKALDLLADRLRKSREKHGPDSLLIGSDPEAGLDFYYCARRFAGLWGTPLIFGPHTEPNKPWSSLLRSPTSTCSRWLESRSILLVESDLASTRPVAFGWLMEAQRRGTKIIVADSRFTRTMAKADLGLMIRPEMGNQLGMALLKLFVGEDLYLKDRVAACFRDPESWLRAFAEAQFEDLAETVGADPNQLNQAAALLAGNAPVTVITSKRLAFRAVYRIWLTMVTAMGWARDNVGGWYPLDSGQPPIDVTGDMEEREERLLEWFYGDHRQILRDLLEPEPEIEPRYVKSMIGSGNCLKSFLSPLAGSAPNMDALAYFGSFPNETWSASHIVFPATMWPEREAICFSDDRAIEWAERVIDPRQDCRSGLDFWAGLAQRFGWDDYFPWLDEDGRADRAAFYEWLLDRSPNTSGLRLEDLKRAHQERRPLIWALAPSSETDPEYRTLPTPDGKIDPAYPDSQGSQRPQPESGYPLYLDNGPVISRSGAASDWLPWLSELEAESLIQVHPDVATALDIETGDEVVVESPNNSIEGRAWLSRTVQRDVLWSQQSLDEHWVLIRRKDQSSQEALNKLEELPQ